MKAFALALSFFTLFCSNAHAETVFDHRPIQAAVEQDLERGKIYEKTGEAFDAMFRMAGQELRKKGRADLADRLETEWNTTGSDALQLLHEMGDVGQHSPFSQWVEDWYQVIEDALGIPTMEATHLRDIWVLNYTLPVVFHPSIANKWCLETTQQHPDDNCRDEYRRHFAGTKWQKDPDPDADKILHEGFMPVVVYWSVWIGCELATSGGGTLICGPAGNLAEEAVERWIAPGISYRIFDKANPSALLFPMSSVDEESYDRL